MSKQVDEETIKELTALQAECEELQRQIVSTNANLATNSNTLRRSKLTLKELDTLPDTTVTYKAIGRIFLQTPLAELKQDLHDVHDECDKATKTLEQQKTYLEKQLDDKVNHWRELNKNAAAVAKS